MHTEKTNFINTKEVERITGLHRNTLRRYADKLNPKTKNGKNNLYDPEVVAKFMEERKRANPKMM